MIAVLVSSDMAVSKYFSIYFFQSQCMVEVLSVIKEVSEFKFVVLCQRFICSGAAECIVGRYEG